MADQSLAHDKIFLILQKVLALLRIQAGFGHTEDKGARFMVQLRSKDLAGGCLVDLSLEREQKVHILLFSNSIINPGLAPDPGLENAICHNSGALGHRHSMSFAGSSVEQEGEHVASGCELKSEFQPFLEPIGLSSAPWGRGALPATLVLEAQVRRDDHHQVLLIQYAGEGFGTGCIEALGEVFLLPALHSFNADQRFADVDRFDPDLLQSWYKNKKDPPQLTIFKLKLSKCSKLLILGRPHALGQGQILLILRFLPCCHCCTGQAGAKTSSEQWLRSLLQFGARSS